MSKTSMPIAPTDTNYEIFLNELRRIVGEDAVLTQSNISETYTHDWARDEVGRCLAVVRPSTTQEVSEVCILCNDTGVTIIPQGGHTGLVGGALQQRELGCIVLTTQLMSRIEDIDPDNMTCIVQAGVVLERLQTELDNKNLYFGVSIGSQGSANIGGLISTNAGGVRVLRYGMMEAQVLGLEVVMADGSIQSSMDGLQKDNRGPDPLRLMIGAEGSLGIITRACLRILPRECYSATAWVGCASFEAALDILRLIRKKGYEALAAFEVMSDSCMPFAAMVRDQYRAPLDAPVHILVEFSSAMDLSLDHHLETLLAEALNSDLASDVIIAQSAAHGKLFWAIREGLVEGHAKRGFHVRSDVSVKLSLIPEAASQLETMLAKEFPGWIPQTYGHLGDGNLHFNAIPPDTFSEDEARRIASSIENRIFKIINELSGSFSAEHGIGRKKIGWFQQTLPERHETLAKIKSVLDPNNTLNPGCLIDNIEK